VRARLRFVADRFQLKECATKVRVTAALRAATTNRERNMLERHLGRLSALAMSTLVTLSVLSGIQSLARSEHAGHDAQASALAASAVTRHTSSSSQTAPRRI
jgi:hypothetical protein